MRAVPNLPLLIIDMHVNKNKLISKITIVWSCIVAVIERVAAAMRDDEESHDRNKLRPRQSSGQYLRGRCRTPFMVHRPRSRAARPGGVAIIFPLLTTLATKIFIGWLFLIGGVTHLIHAFSTRTWGGFVLDLLEGALYLIAGVWLAFFPLAGVLTLTVFVASLFIFQGAVEGVIAFRLRPTKGWGGMLFAGAIAILLGVMIIGGLPGTAAWALGFLVGVKLMSSGWAYLLLALNARR